MAGQTFNWIADKLLIRRQQNNVNLGQLRAYRRFDFNNHERVINDVTGRFGSASQRLAIAQGLGLQTQGLIIGGKRDGGRGYGVQRYAGQQTSPSGAGEKLAATLARNANELARDRWRLQATYLQNRLAAKAEREREERRSRTGTGLPSAPVTPD